MNLVELNVYVAVILAILLSVIAAYAGERAEPCDAATLLVAIRLTEMSENEKYMTPGQLATVLMPRPTRLVRSCSLLASLAVIVLAVLTHWWLLIIGYVVGKLMASYTRVFLTNRSLDHNCFWIVADLENRKSASEAKRQTGKIEAAAALIEAVTVVWDQAKQKDEVVPRRVALRKAYGHQATR